MSIDLKNLNVEQLEDLIRRARARIEEVKDEMVNKLRDELAARAKAHGFDISELFGGRGKGKARAKSTVTIKAEGVDLSGTLSSPRKSCVNGRKVIVIKQVGTRGGGNDKVIASDTASADGTWSTGNTGIEGRFYAKVKKTATCGGDTSKTIRAVR